MEFGIATVAAITVICYLIGLVIKALPWDGSRYIPILCGISGGVLGVIALYLSLPDFPASDPLTAAAQEEEDGNPHKEDETQST